MNALPVRMAYIVSHPIQYQAPLLRRVARAGVDLQVFFVSDFSLQEHQDPEFSCRVRWDVDLVGGYAYSMLATGQTRAPRFFTGSWAGLIVRILRREFDVVWVHGWSYWVNIIALLAARSRGVPTLLRGEARVDKQRRTNYAWTLLYRGLVKLGSAYLCIGTDNREFYEFYGAAYDRLFTMPYCVDNEFFQGHAQRLADRVPELKRHFGLSDERPVILYSGKLTRRKKADCLLRAYSVLVERLPEPEHPYLVFVGDGELRQSLEHEVNKQGLVNVRFYGFHNQVDLCRFYAISDVFVLASEDEPWGLAVNEAMNFGKPVIVSEQVGAGADLVRGWDTGFIVEASDAESLADALERAVHPGTRATLGSNALARIRSWSFDADIDGLLSAIRYVTGRRSQC